MNSPAGLLVTWLLVWAVFWPEKFGGWMAVIWKGFYVGMLQ